MHSSDFDQARSDIKTLIGLDENCRKEGEDLLNEMAILEKKQDEKSKVMYQKFFQ